MLAAVALVAGAQAASVDWKVTGAAAQNGYSVYVMAGSVVSDWVSADAIAAAAVDTGAIAKSGRNYAVTGTATDAALTKASDFYYVVVSADKTQYAVSSAYAGSEFVYNSSATPPETAPATSPSFAADAATYKAFGAVPEPTSGLLMLVGLGALALRRRRA